MDKLDIQQFVIRLSEKLYCQGILSHIFLYRMTIYDDEYPDYTISISFYFTKLIFTIKDGGVAKYQEELENPYSYSMDLIINKINDEYNKLFNTDLVKLGG